jgi:hypothetical protein
MAEDGISLDFRRVNGWFWISQGDGQEHGSKAIKFYSKFGIELT